MSKHSMRGAEWEALCRRIKDRDGHRCTLQYGGCTMEHDLTVDHIQPISLGGTNDEWNLTTACRTCNGRKSDKVMKRSYWIDTEWFNA